MERITRFRGRILLLLFALVVFFYGCHLYDLQIISTGGQTDNTTTFVTLTSVKAARGELLDRNGTVLVGNRAGYNLMLNHYVVLSAENTYELLYKLAINCKEQGIVYNETFPVSVERPFTYTHEQYNSSQREYFQAFLRHYKLDTDITAPLLIETLRNRYKLPETWSDEEARLVIGLVYEVMLRNCVESLPIYEFVSDATDEVRSAVVELNIPGMRVEETSIREYYTEYAAHILGHIGSMSPEQWEYYRPIKGYEMDTKVGQSGFEMAFEEYLHGIDGLRRDTVAADGTLISSEWIREPQAGCNVELTIDINLQRVAEEQMAVAAADLKAKGGDGSDIEGLAAVAIDPRNGQVLACASYPTYDLATIFDHYDELMKDPLLPTFNRALLGTYAPGSTYKMSMVVAAIDSGLITSETIIRDQGKFRKYEDYQPNCLVYTLYGGTHGDRIAATALEVSCNYFFYDIGDRLRTETIDSTAKALGLGEKTGVELQEYAGYRANEETKKLLYDADGAVFSLGDKLAASIGQSDNMFTPIQLAVYAGTLSQQGTRYKTTFLNRVVSPDYEELVMENKSEIANVLEISDDAFRAYNTGMQLVCHSNEGTAWETFAAYPIAVAGKTGTAQHGSGGSEHGSFVCYAPADDPKIAIAIYGEKAGHGASLAFVAREMLDEVFTVGETGEVPSYENQLS